ncbi:MAG TPA: GNAT family N-acetyltransferase [Rhodothermales bacterium]|nr:GNAT family N-acetyltransferase [Rhodothermales bacterium]
MSEPGSDRIVVRNTRPEDFADIERISRLVYPFDEPYTSKYLSKHLEVFPEGQLVAYDTEAERVVGMAASLIIRWDDYDRLDSYDDFTDSGYFTNHDPTGRTLYGAEVMVDPEMRRMGIGSKLYDARRELAERLKLLRIRAGARLPGFHRYAGQMDAETYVRKVIHGELSDPTLSFQLDRGFHVLAVVPNYYTHDPKCRDYAALIEWINEPQAAREGILDRISRFHRLGEP